MKNIPKYFLYSGHDTNIGNLWQYLNPVGFKQDNLQGQFVDWYQIPYASSIQMELHKKKNCTLAKGEDESSCFYVQFTSNGQPLKFKNLDSIYAE